MYEIWSVGHKPYKDHEMIEVNVTSNTLQLRTATVICS